MKYLPIPSSDAWELMQQVVKPIFAEISATIINKRILKLTAYA